MKYMNVKDVCQSIISMNSKYIYIKHYVSQVLIYNLNSSSSPYNKLLYFLDYNYTYESENRILGAGLLV
jgi:hypothetical protein